jgi:hypothetical protein
MIVYTNHPFFANYEPMTLIGLSYSALYYNSTVRKIRITLYQPVSPIHAFDHMSLHINTI